MLSRDFQARRRLLPHGCLLTAGGRLAFVGWDPQEYLDTDGLAGPRGGLEDPTAKRQPSGSIHLRGRPSENLEIPWLAIFSNLASQDDDLVRFLRWEG